jgi:hypothetical protein
MCLPAGGTRDGPLEVADFYIRTGIDHCNVFPEPVFPVPPVSSGTTLSDYAGHVGKTFQVLWADGTPWVLKDRILRSLGMPHRVKPVNTETIRSIMKQTRAVLAQWTEGWDTQPCDWWFVCCDQRDFDLTALSKGPRYDVRRGLEQCEVRRVEPKWFADNGYDVYAAAFRHYGSRPALTSVEFTTEFLRHAEYPGRETWGAFISGKLVAWESCVVVDDAVMSASAKSDPIYFKSRPNNALVYSLTRHYLQERQLSYITAGSRVLVHDTNVQDFKLRMGYRKVYCPLRIELSRLASFMASLSLNAWGRRIGLGKILRGPLNQLDALAAVVRIAGSCVSSGSSRDGAALR